MTFCKQYKCTTARSGNHNKYRNQSDRPDLWDSERLQLHLDTKFEQLKVAIDLEHWRKAFYTVEDIHDLMCKVKKTPKPSLLVVYYAKLTEIFWISSSHLYHAYAWFKLFTLLQKTYHKNLSLKDLQPIASSAVLAALLVVPYNRNHSAYASPLELENEKERNLRMANLIGFELNPKIDNREVLSRSFLLSQLVSKGVVSCASQEVKELYNLLEHEFLPLGLASKAQTLLVKIKKLSGKLASASALASSVPEVQLSRYVPALEKLITLKQLQQVSKVYQVMKIEGLFSMIPFFDDFSPVERISLEAAKHNFLSLKIDHMRQIVVFGPESDGLSDHLTTFAESLYKLRDMIICPPAPKLIFSGLGEVVDKERRRLLARKSIIEERKLKEQERQLVEMEREEESRRQQNKMTEEAEQKRVVAEFEQRKNQRMLREVEEAQAQSLLQEAEKGISKRKGAKQETEKKLQKMANTVDYFERAKREEGVPLMEAAFRRRLEEEKVLLIREQQLEVELSRQRHDRDLKEKNRLSRMLENKNIFRERVLNHRRLVEDRRKAEREERIKLFIQARKHEREVKRKKIVYVRTEEDRIKKLGEEKEARKREEAERRKKEEAKRKAKLDELAEKQSLREREVEEKQQLRRGALFGRSSVRASQLRTVAPAAPTSGKYVPMQLRGKAECYH